MWIVTEKGVARNLSMATKIEYIEDNGATKVYAKFPVYMCGSAASEELGEDEVIKTFDTTKDAIRYVRNLALASNLSAMDAMIGELIDVFDNYITPIDEGATQEVTNDVDKEANPQLHKGESLIDGIPL